MESPRLGFDPCPIAAPMPTTIPTYTAVMNPARAENTTVLLMTTSMSYRRYLSTAMATAAGMPKVTPTVEMTPATTLTAGRLPWAAAPMEAATTVTMRTYASHRNWWRSWPLARRHRMNGADAATARDTSARKIATP